MPGVFATQIAGNLDTADWNTRREIIRTAIDHIEVKPAQIRITYRINFPLFSTAGKIEKVCSFVGGVILDPLASWFSGH